MNILEKKEMRVKYRKGKKSKVNWRREMKEGFRCMVCKNEEGTCMHDSVSNKDIRV